MQHSPFPTDALPRVRLAHLPTPIEHLPRLSEALGGPQIYVKRDDQTGLATGGNKARKLEFLMAQAVEAGADSVITAGAVQSNHARQTAAAARKLGLAPHLVLHRPEGGPPSVPQGNLLIDRIVGAEIHWTDEPAPYSETIARVDADLRSADHTPYAIPYGGSSPVGMMGYTLAMHEVAEQTADMDQPFAAHIFASSSGGMHAGMILGAALTGLLNSTPLVGISIADPADVLKQQLHELVSEGADLLGVDAPIDEGAYIVNDDYLGGGYAVVGEPEREAVRLAAQHEGLLLDPVYTGRAFAGLIDLIRQGAYSPGENVLFWHSGGTAGLFAFADELGLA